jgi:hypothetical protein
MYKTWKPTCAIWFPAILSSLPLSGWTVGCASSSVSFNPFNSWWRVKFHPFETLSHRSRPFHKQFFTWYMLKQWHFEFMIRNCIQCHWAQMKSICKNSVLWSLLIHKRKRTWTSWTGEHPVKQTASMVVEPEGSTSILSTAAIRHLETLLIHSTSSQQISLTLSTEPWGPPLLPKPDIRYDPEPAKSTSHHIQQTNCISQVIR